MLVFIKLFFLSAIAISLIWLAASYIRLRMLTARAEEYITATEPYESSGSGKRVLVLGDSLAYGTGTSSPDKSVAGLVAGELNNPQVENRSKNGKRTDQLAREMNEITENYDIILIIIGGNDIIRPYINLDDSAANLLAIYSHASEHAEKVIVLTTGNLKYTTFFLPPLRQVVAGRSVRLRNNAVKIAASLNNVTYVDIVSYNERVNFVSEYEAEDKLHLSDAGAKYWRDAILQSTNNLSF